MIQMQEMDRAVTIRDQLSDEGREPVVFVNVFTVAPEDVDALVEAWTDDARYFKRQDGFISAQLHRGIAGSTAFVNYAVWQSVAQFRAAFAHPDFHAKLARYPKSATGSPHLFRKLAVDGICVV